MVKKLKAALQHDDQQLADVVRATAQQIWQAGLGAFAKAQEEGEQVFSTLVEQGSNLRQRSAQRQAVQQDSGASTDGASWDKLEAIFDDRVARALVRMSVPTREEVEQLRQQVAQLSAQVGALAQQGGAVVVPTVSAAPRARRPATASVGEPSKRERRKLD